MIKKLRNNFKFSKTELRKISFLKNTLIIIIHLGWMSGVQASTEVISYSPVDVLTSLNVTTNTPKVVRSYNITDASTMDKSCFPTKGRGVIFQRADGCKGYHHIWRVNDKLTMNEYDNNTATIVGSVIDDQGQIGQVSIALYDKQNQGATWNAKCYVDGISDPRSLYQSFNGTIKVGSQSFSVEKKVSEKHFILAEGAGFEPGQFGFGAWTSGSFGGCTEWFGNLDPIDINCDLTVDAGNDVSVCDLDEVVLTATVKNPSECSEIISSYKIIDSNTEAGCFTADPGVIFQKGGDCKGIDYIWRATDNLVLNEFADQTATITGNVIDQNGRVGIVDIKLMDKEHSGNTWNASCYLDGISGPETFYRSFYGTITADGIPVTVGTRFNAHYILAQGAGFDNNQYGFGAWTGGAFGECTEWFGNLVPIQIENPTQEVEYLWSTGETTQTITVTEPGAYTVTVTDCEGCEATDEVLVSVDTKVTIGDFVWLDDNRNGLQDDGATGVNDVKVTLYQCNGDEVASTITADNANGASGAYSFEVCPNSGSYYVVFGNLPDGTEFTNANAGNDNAMDSDANQNGRTNCFEVTDMDVPTIDGGLIEICNIEINAGDDVSICAGETIEITASLIENTAECESVCVFPIIEQERCSGALGTYEIFLMSTTGSIADALFKASEQNFERYADNSMRYTATASNGMDEIQIDAMFTGYTTNAPINSPKENMCQQYDTSDWEYWTTWSGTITSENHGVFNLSVKGAAFQMGVGADQMRTGLGASGWFYADGGDGFYVDGDVNVAIKPCVENGVMYKWTTEDGAIVGDAYQKTISVNQAGTYTVEAINCIDCITSDTIVVTEGSCAKTVTGKSGVTAKMSSVYPIPAQSGGRITVEIEMEKEVNEDSEFNVIPLKAAVDFPDRQEDITMILYDIMGRVINIPRTFKMVNGKAIVYLELDHIPSGKYILQVKGSNWSDAKNVLVK